MDFPEGKSEQIWQYEKKIEELEKDEENAKVDRQNTQKDLEVQDNLALQQTYQNIIDVEPPLDKQVQ